MIKRLDIEIPDMNDSYSRVVLDGTEYTLRFTWNETAERWYFGIYTLGRIPLVQGIRIVPMFPFMLNYVNTHLPHGTFGVFTKLESIGRKDFSAGKAVFSYISEV